MCSFLEKPTCSLPTNQRALDTSAEECCRERGVPDVCFGYCEKENEVAVQRNLQTGICGKWFKAGELVKGSILLLTHCICCYFATLNLDTKKSII